MSPDMVKAVAELVHELSPIILIVISSVAAWQSYRAKQAIKVVREETSATQAVNGKKIDDAASAMTEKLDAVHETVNGRMTQLLDEATKNAKAEAVAELKANSDG